jgi:ElaB/YqjD/DUF883 family membrane-anchored ribosome-binding protein
MDLKGASSDELDRLVKQGSMAKAELDKRAASARARTAQVQAKINARRHMVEKCEEGCQEGRVYITEGNWATCTCAGGDGLLTDWHEY